jgi:phosphoadenosine phosphosulfate reductase
MNGLPLYRSVETAAAITDRVLVSFSGGKDSVITLDLCMRHFKHVECFFMYQVRGLSFQENICRYYEDKYGIPIHRIPHFELSQWLRYGLFRVPDFDSPIVSTKQTYDYMRENTDIWWIAAGERISDSIVRRAMIKNSGTIDVKRGRFFPVAEWRKQDIKAYIRQNKLRVGIESEKLGFSFRSFMPKDLIAIRKYFPKDYALIRKWFPLVDVSIIQHEMLEARNGGIEQSTEI